MEFFQERTRVRLRSRDYFAYSRADEGGEETIVHRDDGALDEARAADCLVRGGNHYFLSNGAGAAFDQHLGQIVNGDSPGGLERSDAFQRTNDARQDEFFANRTHGASSAAHRLLRDGTDLVLFHSASYGRYLSQNEDEVEDEDDCFPVLCTFDSPEQDNMLFQAFRAADGSGDIFVSNFMVGDEDNCFPVQSTYDSLEEDKVLFQAFRAEDWSGDIFISNFMIGDWCHPDDEEMPFRWVLQAIAPRGLLPPELLHPILVNPTQLKDGPSVPLYRRVQLLLQRVLLRRRRTIDQRHFNPLEWRFLQFDGRYVFKLRRDLAAELGEADNILGITLAGSSGQLTPLVIDLPPNKETILATRPPEIMLSTWAASKGRLAPVTYGKLMDMVLINSVSQKFMLITWAASKGRLAPVTYGKLMDMVLINSVSQKTNDTYNIRPSRMRFHGLPSRITEAQIVDMYNFLIYVGDQHFLDVFIGCLKPIDEGQLEEHTTYREFLGNPLQQTVSGTCAIVSSTKCVEMQHRWKYETYYGLGTFPCQAAAPRKLRSLCRRKEVWSQSAGAYVGDVMDTIMRMGGIRTTNAPTPTPYFLPLQSWERHGCDIGDGLTANQIMDLLDSSGPFVGTMWVCPWYSLFDANEDDDLVYRSGCARSMEMQIRSKNCFRKYKVSAGLHSVVCFAYRLTDGGELHVLTLDNHTTTGPKRWIHYSELQEVHTVSVERLDPPVYLGTRVIVYPRSNYI